MKWIRQQKEKKFVCFIVMLCFLCSGCGAKESERQDAPENATDVETGIVDESETEPETTLPEKRALPEIPKTKKEEEELFGKTTSDGRWILPEGAYRSWDGYIYNKEGLVIGQWRKPTEKEIENAVG